MPMFGSGGDLMKRWKADLKKAHDAIRPRQDAPNIVRHAAVICEVRKTKKPRTYTFVGSTSRAALDDGVLLPDGMDGERYDANPVVLWAHDQSSPPVGRTVERRRAKEGWEFDVEFADTEDAREIAHLVDTGFLKATSVGFRVTEYDRGASAETKGQLGLSPNGWIGRKWQLLELSIVPVGADPGALATAEAHALATRAALAQRATKSGYGWPVAVTTVGDATDNASTWTMTTHYSDAMQMVDGGGAKGTRMADEPTAARPEDEPMPEDEGGSDPMAEINAKLDTIAAACAQMMELMSGQKMADDDEEAMQDEEPPEDETDEEDDEEDPEAERSAGLYDALFNELKRAKKLAQEVAL